MMRLISHQRGDTIVEVLIAIAVVSSVLGGAYATANRNVKNSQQAQEQSRALKVAESQLEQLSKVADPSTLPPSFCINGGTPDSNPDHCKVDDNVGDGRYAVTVTKDPLVSGLFTASVNWDGALGTASNVSLVYRVF